MNDTADKNAPHAESTVRRFVFPETLLVFAVFFLQGATPVPDVNEPYYLSKAIHFWNPDWIADDAFLNSADTHKVFYFTFGWLSLWLPPAVLAWAGRLVTWGLMAWAWQRLSFAVVPRRWMSIITATTFVCLLERCQMAGEWVVGGVEAKGFAYVLVFLGLEALAKGQWNRVWLLLGGASAFHVLVGGWSAVATGFAWLCLRGERWPVSAIWPAVLGGLLISLPGLLPSLTLTWGVDPEIVRWANEIYVFARLPHHLVPAGFNTDFVVRFILLTAVCLFACWVPPASGAVRRLRLFVAGALAIALCGVVISIAAAGHPALAASLLRYYWFRLSDVAVPLGVALGGPHFLSWLLAGAHARQVVLCRRWNGTFAAGFLMGVVAAGVLLATGWHQQWELAFPDLVAVTCVVTLLCTLIWLVLSRLIGKAVQRSTVPERPAGRGVVHGGPAPHFASAAATSVALLVLAVPALHLGGKAAALSVPRWPPAIRLPGPSAWRRACNWVAKGGNVPADARFLTPATTQTFKWYAGRAEVVNWKEIPQDARSIVQWWKRMNDVYYSGRDEPGQQWVNSLAQWDAARLERLGADYQAEYVLTLRWPRMLNLDVVYRNEYYVIYRLEGRRQR